MTLFHNFLDTHVNVLYCSRECAIKGGATKRLLTRVNPKQYLNSFATVSNQPGAPLQSPWGNVCPGCTKNFHGFPLVYTLTA